ncbi:MAG TPA: adenylate/guanylate cyclase domain-containing protein [Oligoflexus sp.]|uniref:adenylate/guanylate cyclase domain-containing protein n=1 Tax=Oligoflexus sp. TaxID=1971216 RepID=UPI002D8036F9|nr:adenylate/guanylate cyclase domain-containing protein [Oligoflexus sp.]HET9239431.1 adenylate/guanylate cyclase domain-containing protein [Oligoflexus sp.]
MFQRLQSWLDARDAPRPILGRWLLAAILIALGLHAVESSPLGKLLDQKLIQALEFRLRAAMGQGPQLDPRLKIYFMDDRSIRSLGRDDLDFQEWAEFFKAVAAAKPRLIMIDKIFATPRGRYDADKISEDLKAAGVPLASIVFMTADTLKFVEPIPLDLPIWAKKRWMPSDMELDWLPVTPRAVYGPHVDVQKSFSLFGHAHYSGGGTVELFHRPAADVLIPHWSLWAADWVTVGPQGIAINGQRMTTRTAEVLVNLLDRETILKQSFSLDRAFKRAEKNVSFADVITPEQIVLILPGMYTGSSDLVETPMGSIPGGYLMIAMVNSVITGQWIQTIAASLPKLFLGTMLGVLAGLLLEPMIFALIFLLATSGAAALGLALFAFADIKIFWLWPNLGFVLLSLSALTWKMMRRDSKNRTLQAALADVIATDQLQKILANPNVLIKEPSAQNVSIMFLDLVGFSLTSQRLPPQETFAQLKDLLHEATRIIHRHEGVIDKTLGDGLLCFFGYNLLGQTQSAHADQAVQCAMAIQRRLYERCLTAHDKGEALYPARIGINTAQVYIGNIGNETRFDFTLIGDGVNFASRLESACEPFRIMIGSETRELLGPWADASILIPRYVRVKHSQQLVKAWQVDPFQSEPGAIERAERLYWNFARIERLEERLELPPLKVLLRSEHGVFELRDFSRTGLALVGDIFLAKDVLLDVSMDVEDEGLMKKLQDWGLASFTIEIRWGKIDQHRFKHGAKILGLNGIQRNRIFEELQRQGKPAA